MLFSYRVKNEIARIIPKNISSQKDELVAFLTLKGNLFRENKSLSITVNLDSSATTRKCYTLLKNIFDFVPVVKQIRISPVKKRYVVEINSDVNCRKILKELNLKSEHTSKEIGKIMYDKKKIMNHLFSREAFLRGAFLVDGYINDPEKMYHMEISLDLKKEAKLILDFIKDYDLNFRMSYWKKKWVIYLKKGDSIFEFLRLLGVQDALLYFQDIRARKDILNKVNRAVNCETANLDKTVLSAAIQLQNIDKIEKKIGFKNIHSKLVSIAKLRRRLPYASLQELSEETELEITKSGIYHRLKKINQIAEEL